MSNILSIKNIIISSYFFYPEHTPRAFRTFELAKEFAKRGYHVRICIPKNTYNYTKIEKEYGFKIIQISSGLLFKKHSTKELLKTLSKKDKKSSVFLTSFKKMLLWFCFGGRSFEYAFLLFSKLNHIVNEKTIVISIGLPITPHFATLLFRLFKKKYLHRTIADYGDPYSSNPYFNVPRWQQSLEKYMLAKIDYITIPTVDSIPAYQSIMRDLDQIRIIPQGFDFSTIKTAKYCPNNVPIFCYAGIFYENIRDPQYFFEYLEKSTHDFLFIIYTLSNHLFTQSIIEKYEPILHNKLKIIYDVPREKLIYELSKADFLINFNNTSSIQTPSKLIDYALADRPILSLNTTETDFPYFNQFLKRDYSNATEIDIKKYNIIQIASQFEELF